MGPSRTPPLVLEISQYVSVKEAVSSALAALHPPEAETVPTRKAFGRVAAETLVSGLDTPPFNTSHMDGFAIRAKDSVGATGSRPKMLALVGAVPLGKKPVMHLGTNETARVSTGSFLPAGADSAGIGVEVAKPVALATPPYCGRQDEARRPRRGGPTGPSRRPVRMREEDALAAAEVGQRANRTSRNDCGEEEGRSSPDWV
jgi:hypothetical protein